MNQQSTIEISIGCDPGFEEWLEQQPIRKWILNVLHSHNVNAGLDLYVCGAEYMRELNQQFRGKDAPTNVLAFPAGEELKNRFLGDVALCLPVVREESARSNKPLSLHCAHLVTHGVLHLLGYDHGNRADADVMESEEVRLLAQLNMPDPYQE